MASSDQVKPGVKGKETEGPTLGDSDDLRFEGVIKYFLGNGPLRGGKTSQVKLPLEDD